MSCAPRLACSPLPSMAASKLARTHSWPLQCDPAPAPPDPSEADAAWTDCCLRRGRASRNGGGSRQFSSWLTERVPIGNGRSWPPPPRHSSTQSPFPCLLAHWMGERPCHFEWGLAPASSSALTHDEWPWTHASTRAVACIGTQCVCVCTTRGKCVSQERHPQRKCGSREKEAHAQRERGLHSGGRHTC